MAHTYEVQLNYKATLTVAVEANDEGEAYTKAQALAEESDINQYVIGTEMESVCNCVE